MKKFMSMLLALAMCFSLAVPAFAAEVETSEDAVAYAKGGSEISPMIANLEKTFTLAPGEKQTFQFKMNNGTGTAHNTFNVKVSNVSGGTYKIIITGTNGFNYASPEKSTAYTHTVEHAAKDVTYTVMILNTGSTHLSAKAQITSYAK